MYVNGKLEQPSVGLCKERARAMTARAMKAMITQAEGELIILI